MGDLKTCVVGSDSISTSSNSIHSKCLELLLSPLPEPSVPFSNFCFVTSNLRQVLIFLPNGWTQGKFQILDAKITCYMNNSRATQENTTIC